MRNRLARKMAAEMRGATCAGTQTSKAPTLSGPSVTNHYSVIITFGKCRNAHGIACWISCLQRGDACILYFVVCMWIFLTIFGNFTLLNLR